MKDMLESRAKTFLDTLAQVYIEYTLQNQMLVNKKTEEYIDKQLDGVMLIMDSLEGVLENFKDVKEILDLEKEQNKAFKMLEETEKEERSLQLRMNALINIEDFLAKETDLSIIPPLNLLQEFSATPPTTSSKSKCAFWMCRNNIEKPNWNCATFQDLSAIS